jgi:hypothetical protein
MRRRLSLFALAAAAPLLLAVRMLAQAPPTPPPTPTATCPPAPPSRLIVHDRARVALDDPRPLNMRDGAGTDFDVIAQVPAGGVIYVLEGPRCTARYAWYRVEYEGIEGWIAEGDDTAYFVDIYPPG